MMRTEAAVASAVVNAAIEAFTSPLDVLDDVLGFLSEMSDNAPLLGTGAWMMSGGIEARVKQAKLNHALRKPDVFKSLDDMVGWVIGVRSALEDTVSSSFDSMGRGRLPGT